MRAGFDSHVVKQLDPSALPEILAQADRRRERASGAIITS